MATDRVSRRTGLRLHRAGIPEKGLGAAPLGAPDPHLNCRTPSSFPPQPRPPARPLALGGPSEDGGGGWLSPGTPQPYGGAGWWRTPRPRHTRAAAIQTQPAPAAQDRERGRERAGLAGE